MWLMMMRVMMVFAGGDDDVGRKRGLCCGEEDG